MASGAGKEAWLKILHIIIEEIYVWAEAVLRWVPGQSGSWIRKFWYRKRFKACGQHLRISTGCFFGNCANISLGHNVSFGLSNQIYAHGALGDALISIGDNSAFNSGVMINADCGGSINIGEYVLVGPNVVFRASNHNYGKRNIPLQKQGHTAGKIIVADDVWIGANAVILPDVSIGRGAIVGAGAVVTRNVEPYAIIGGVPARRIGARGEN